MHDIPPYRQKGALSVTPDHFTIQTPHSAISCMSRSAKIRKKALATAAKDQKIQDACQALRNGEYKNMTDAAKAFNVSYDAL